MWIRTINGIVFIEVEQTGQGMYVPKINKGDSMQYYFSRTAGWIRPFNKRGIAWKNLKYHRLYFSERNGYTKYIKIFNWIIGKID